MRTLRLVFSDMSGARRAPARTRCTPIPLTHDTMLQASDVPSASSGSGKDDGVREEWARAGVADGCDSGEVGGEVAAEEEVGRVGV